MKLILKNIKTRNEKSIGFIVVSGACCLLYSSWQLPQETLLMDSLQMQTFQTYLQEVGTHSKEMLETQVVPQVFEVETQERRMQEIQNMQEI